MRFLTIILLTALMALASANHPAHAQTERVGQSGQIKSSGKADIGGSFTLTDHNGERFTDEDLKGKPHLVYFGFSYCPDVCPVDLQRLGAALAKVDPDGEIFRTVFITIDPERDTAEQLAAYVNSNSFPKGLRGLTGTQAEIDKVVLAYKAYAQKMADETNSFGYTFNHTNQIYLMDRNGDYLESFTNRERVDFIADRLSAHAGKGRQLKKYIFIACLAFLSIVFLLIGRMGKNALKAGEDETA